MQKKEEKKDPSFAQILEELTMLKEEFGDELDGKELGEEFKAELDRYVKELFAQAGSKVDGFGQLCKIAPERAKAMRAEARRLEAGARSLENTLKYIKVAWLAAMDNAGLPKVHGDIYKVIRQSREVVAIDDEARVPKKYLRVKTTIEPDKELIMDALKEGKKVRGCRLAESAFIKVS